MGNLKSARIAPGTLSLISYTFVFSQTSVAVQDCDCCPRKGQGRKGDVFGAETDMISASRAPSNSNTNKQQTNKQSWQTR